MSMCMETLLLRFLVVTVTSKLETAEANANVNFRCFTLDVLHVWWAWLP